MTEFKYLTGYSEEIISSVKKLFDTHKAQSYILKRYPEKHNISNNKKLFEYVNQLKNKHFKKAKSLSRVYFDDQLLDLAKALGTNTFVSRVQGAKLKSKNEIRISSVFKNCPKEFLHLICVHELAHLKEKEHNKAFYNLCLHLEPDYFQIELDLRIFLTLKNGKIV